MKKLLILLFLFPAVCFSSQWENIDGKEHYIIDKPMCNRLIVPHGWLVSCKGGGSATNSITFYPDPDHEWRTR